MISRLFLLLLLFVAINVQAQTDTLRAQADSFYESPPETPFLKTLDRIGASRAYQMTYVGVPLIVGGLIVKCEDDHFRQLRNDYVPVFRYRYDDYLQYLPAAVMVGLKVGGVEGRSSWGRMLTSDAFSAATMALAVNVIKSTANVERPDGSNRHSFPSGHTATAFMTATMLSKEYGDRSPWYSIGAYSVATATGLSRMANNKHWLSDVLVGAGIGILSTELGYFFADLIFKDKGINYFPVSEEIDRFRRPSFFGVKLGLNIVPGTYVLSDNSRLSYSSGSTAGLEGAWYMNPYVGFGGQLSVSNMAVIVNNEALDESLDCMSGYAGAYFSYPLTTRLSVGSKLLAGYSYFSKCNLANLTLGDKGGMSMATECAVTVYPKEKLGVKFYLDYYLLPQTVKSNKKCTSLLTLGSSVSVIF